MSPGASGLSRGPLDSRPPSAEDIDAVWLTTALEAAGVARGAIVESVEPGVEIGTGQAARSLRFKLSWDRPEGRPGSVVGKFPSKDEGAKATLAATGGYWKEWLFYDRIAPTVDVRVPASYAAVYDEATSDFALVMEDIQDARPGDQMQGLTSDELSLAVDQAARLHGPRLGDPLLEGLLNDGPGGSTLAEAGQFCEDMYGAVLPDFLERFGGSVEGPALEFIAETKPFVARWFRGTGTPATLVHQDLRADNLLFTGGTAAPEVVVVDFQSLSRGVGATDLAYLIGGSVREWDERADLERELLERYRTGLRQYEAEPGSDALWIDYRHGSLWGVIMTVLSSIGAARTERGDLMFAEMANRHASHALELEALSVLR